MVGLPVPHPVTLTLRIAALVILYKLYPKAGISLEPPPNTLYTHLLARFNRHANTRGQFYVRRLLGAFWH